MYPNDDQFMNLKIVLLITIHLIYFIYFYLLSPDVKYTFYFNKTFVVLF